MGQEFLIDTNTIIDFQIKRIPTKGQDYISKIIDENFIISFISYIEFLAFKDVTQSMEDFIALADIIEINKSIIDQTILIRKHYKVKLPDAIIAATAMVNNLTLISRNTKDFYGIKKLKLLNPYEL